MLNKYDLTFQKYQKKKSNVGEKVVLKGKEHKGILKTKVH